MLRKSIFVLFSINYFCTAWAADSSGWETQSAINQRNTLVEQARQQIFSVHGEETILAKAQARAPKPIVEFIIEKDPLFWETLISGAFQNKKITAQDLVYVLTQKESPTGVLEKNKNNETLFKLVIENNLGHQKYSKVLRDLLLKPSIVSDIRGNYKLAVAEGTYSPFLWALKFEYNESLQLIMMSWPLTENCFATTKSIESRKYIDWKYNKGPAEGLTPIAWLLRADPNPYTYLQGSYARAHYVSLAKSIIDYNLRVIDQGHSISLKVLELAAVLFDVGKISKEVLEKIRNASPTTLDSKVRHRFNHATRTILERKS